MKVEKISAEQINEIWTKKLWNGRTTEIRTMSSMLYLKGYDVTIYDKYEPTFFGIYDSKELVGVNSGHRTNDSHYRSRGLYVDPQYRGKGLGRMLLESTMQKAKDEGCDFCWSYPRQSSIGAYLSVGFRITSEWQTENNDFGPNCFVIKCLTAI